MATAHILAKLREKNPSVVDLGSCKKRVPKHKYFKNNGELGIGTGKLFSATLKSQNFQWTDERACATASFR